MDVNVLSPVNLLQIDVFPGAECWLRTPERLHTCGRDPRCTLVKSIINYRVLRVSLAVRKGHFGMPVNETSPNLFSLFDL